MKRKILGVILFMLCFITNLSASNDPINSIIGDASYREKFGTSPSQKINENERIEIHLRYVLHLLKESTSAGLSKTQMDNRAHVISLLEKYIALGKFPRNYDHPGKRIPCFIDKNGNICAVGFLVAETAGYETAESINQEFKYNYIYEMNSPVLFKWVEESGLTIKECAMIQPTYGYYYSSASDHRATSEFVISSSLLGGVNMVFTTVNTFQAVNHSDNTWFPILSGITGGTQLFIGMNSAMDRSFKYADPDKKTISAFNIAMGTGTVIMAVINLINKPSSKNTTTGGSKLSLTTIPITKDKSAYGVKFSMGF